MNIRVTVDRFHQKGHVHPMCKTITNADCVCNGNRDVFQSINTSVAEQCFSYLSKFKWSLRGLGFPHSTIFMILLLHLWNIKRSQMRADDFGLAARYLRTIQSMFLTKCVFEMVNATRTEPSITDKVSSEAMDTDDDEESESSSSQSATTEYSPWTRQSFSIFCNQWKRESKAKCTECPQFIPKDSLIRTWNRHRML